MMDFGLVSPFPAQMTRITFAVWGKPNKAVGHNAVAVSGFVMVQAFHQLVVILQTALAIFRAADQFCGGQHLVP